MRKATMIELLGKENMTRETLRCKFLLTDVEGDGKSGKTIFLSVDDALKMVNGSERYDLSGQSYWIIPRQIRFFQLKKDQFVRFAFEKGLISGVEYLDFCMGRLASYQKRFDSKTKICTLFFEQFATKKMREKYEDFWEMYRNFDKEDAFAELPKITKRMGGEFQGCYYDEWSCKRPITSRVYYELQNDYIECLKYCFREEICPKEDAPEAA